MMDKTPTAEEFLDAGLSESGFQFEGQMRNIAKRKLIEFAKLHVKAALEEASNNAKITHTEVEVCDNHTPYWGPCGNCGYYSMPTVDVAQINKDSILNSYPLENIK
jgi:hypothetical protein